MVVGGLHAHMKIPSFMVLHSITNPKLKKNFPISSRFEFF